jgi:hypothetical protein
MWDPRHLAPLLASVTYYRDVFARYSEIYKMQRLRNWICLRRQERSVRHLLCWAPNKSPISMTGLINHFRVFPVTKDRWHDSPNDLDASQRKRSPLLRCYGRMCTVFLVGQSVSALPAFAGSDCVKQ